MRTTVTSVNEASTQSLNPYYRIHTCGSWPGYLIPATVTWEGREHFRDKTHVNPRLYLPGYPPGFRNHSSYYRKTSWRMGNELSSWQWRPQTGVYYCYTYFAYPFNLISTWKWGTTSTMPYAGSSIQTSLRDHVRTKALKKLKGRTMNLAETAGEWKQTYRMVNNHLKTILGIVRDIKHGHLTKMVQLARRLKRPLSDVWLEWRYGIRPLLNDIYSISGALDKAQNGCYDSMWLYVVKVQEHDDEYEDWIDRTIASGLVVRQRRRGWASCRMRARYDYMVETDRYLSLVDLGVLDPVLLAWELQPFSFVVDWFLGVSDFLEGWTAQLGLKYLDGSISLNAKSTDWAEPWMAIQGQDRLLEKGRDDTFCGAKTHVFIRWKESQPVPSLVPNPDMIRDLMGFRLIDTIALIDQALFGRRANYRR